MNVYALYKGDELLAMGTVPEIAKLMGVIERTIWFYGTPTYAKRRPTFNARRLIKID